MHRGEVPLVDGLDARDLVEVVGAERAHPGERVAGRQVAEGTGRAAGTAGRCRDCFGGGSMVDEQFYPRPRCLTHVLTMGFILLFQLKHYK